MTQPVPLHFTMAATAKQEAYREERARWRELLRAQGFDIPQVAGRQSEASKL